MQLPIRLTWPTPKNILHKLSYTYTSKKQLFTNEENIFTLSEKNSYTCPKKKKKFLSKNNFLQRRQFSKQRNLLYFSEKLFSDCFTKKVKLLHFRYVLFYQIS